MANPGGFGPRKEIMKKTYSKATATDATLICTRADIDETGVMTRLNHQGMGTKQLLRDSPI
jgi:hypothetical protein